MDAVNWFLRDVAAPRLALLNTGTKEYRQLTARFMRNVGFWELSLFTRCAISVVAFFWVVKLGLTLWSVLRAVLSALASPFRGMPGASRGDAASSTSAGGAGDDADDADGRHQQPQGKSIKALLRETRTADPHNVAKSDERAMKNAAFVSALKGAGGIVTGLQWWYGGAGGNWMVTACDDGMLRVYDVSAPGREGLSPAHTVRLGASPVGAAFLERPDTLVALCGGAGSASLNAGRVSASQGWGPQWASVDLHRGAPKCLVSAPTCGLGGGVVVTSARGDETKLNVFSAAGQRLETLDTSKVRNNQIAMAPDGKLFAAACWTSDTPVWEIKFDRTGQFVGVKKAFQLTGAHKAEVYGVAFSASAPRMATCCKDGTVALWNIDVRYQSGEDPKLVSRWETQQPGGQAYQHVAVSPDAQFVAASCQSSIDVFDSAGQLVDRIEDAHVGEVAELAFSGTLKVTAGQPHKHLLASRGNDKRVRLWRCGA